MKRPTTAQNVALSVTAAFALLLALLLLGVHLDLARHKPAPPGETLAMADLEEEEIMEEERVIEPEIADLGDPETDLRDEDAPMPQGEPDQSEVKNDKLVVNGPNPKANDESEKLVATRRQSDSKTTPPSRKEEPDQRITGMRNKFSPKNGKTEGQGQTAASGQGGRGAGLHGVMNGGRKLLNNPTFSDYKITKQNRVIVTVIVLANGTVEPGSSQISQTTYSVDSDIRAKIKQYSERTKWTPKEGAPKARATLTWTLMPAIN